MAVCDYTTSDTGTADIGITGSSFPLSLGCVLSAGHPLVGEELVSITTYNKVSTSYSPTSLTCYHYDGSDRTTIKATSQSEDIVQFVNTWVETKWTFTTPATVAAGDYIAVNLPTGVTATSFFCYANTETTDTTAVEFRGSWTVKTDGLRFAAEYTCSPPPSSGSTLLPPPPAFVSL